MKRQITHFKITNSIIKKGCIYTPTLHTYRKTGLWGPSVSKVFTFLPTNLVLFGNCTMNFKNRKWITFSEAMLCLSFVQFTKVLFILSTLGSPGCDPKQIFRENTFSELHYLFFPRLWRSCSHPHDSEQHVGVVASNRIPTSSNHLVLWFSNCMRRNIKSVQSKRLLRVKL